MRTMSSRPRTHYARGRVRKQALLDAATELIAERGLEGLSHRSVAARANVPSSTPGYFFASMDELAGAAVTQVAENLLSAVEALVADLESGGIDREDFTRRLIEHLVRTRRQEVVVQFEAYLAAGQRSELREPVERVLTGFETAAAKGLEAFGVAHPGTVARRFVAVIDGFALHRIACPRGDDEAVLLDTLHRLVESFQHTPASSTGEEPH